MTARTPASPWPRSTAARFLLGATLLAGCRTDTPAAALSTAPEGEDAESADAETPTPAATALIDRDL